MVQSSRLHRLFVGLSLPLPHEPRLEELVRKLKATAAKKELDIKWSPPTNFHVTLKFLGEVDESRLTAARASLQAMAPSLQAITLDLWSVGAFPDVNWARVLWVGVRNTNALRALQEQVETALVGAGFPARDEEFIPHVTLGRLRNKKNVKDLISPFVRREYGEFKVARLTLFESHLQGNFPIYKALEEYELPSEGIEPLC